MYNNNPKNYYYNNWWYQQQLLLKEPTSSSGHPTIFALFAALIGFVYIDQYRQPTRRTNASTIYTHMDCFYFE